MNPEVRSERIIKPKVIRNLERFRIVFFWLFWFYPKARSFEIAYLLYAFFPQKILRINGNAPWPVHFTSRVLYTKNIKVGSRSAPGLNSNCYVQGRAGIIIGNNFRMGPGSGLISANHDPGDYDKWINSKPIRIGNHVWLGMNVVVMPGVSIGDNVIIGANSVVTTDIPPNSVAAGIPCKVIKTKEPYAGKSYNSSE